MAGLGSASAGLGFGLAGSFLGFRLAFGWISVGFRLRLDLASFWSGFDLDVGLILVWSSAGLVFWCSFTRILLGFRFDLAWISVHHSFNSSHSSLGSPRKS